MILTADEHCIGRLVDDTRFQIDSNAVSAKHCKIYRKKVTNEDDKQTSGCNKTGVFLKDTRFCIVFFSFIWFFRLFLVINL